MLHNRMAASSPYYPMLRGQQISESGAKPKFGTAIKKLGQTRIHSLTPSLFQQPPAHGEEPMFECEILFGWLHLLGRKQCFAYLRVR